ncbi:hypothetical protein ACFFJB_09455 [Camelimonas abortus]|uniref:hypothetical protein n=1 Tax=Camelimonas abortus TaxID=1017184 RepID=UPI0035EA021A
MINALLSAASAHAAGVRRSVIRLAIGLGLAVAALITVMVALLRALFIVVTWLHGPVTGYLAVAGAALLVAVIGFAIAFWRPRPAAGPAPLAAPAAPGGLGAGVVNAAAEAGVRAAGAAAGQAFDAARAAGERIRAIGENLAEDLTGERKKPVSRSALVNAALAATLLGVLLGRRM